MKTIDPDRRISVFILLLIFLLVIVVRFHWRDVPLERDEGEYAYTAQLIAEGGVPYRDVYTMKWPGAHLCYGVIFLAFGQSMWAVRIGHIVVAMITLALMYVLGKRIAGERFGVITAGAFAVMSLAPGFDAPYANAEQFVILFAVAGMVLMLRGIERSTKRSIYAAGMAFGFAVVIKQHAVLLLIGAMAYLLVDRRSWKAAWVHVALCAAGVVTVIAPMVGWLAWEGVWEPFVFWTFTYPRSYVTQIASDQISRRLLYRWANIFLAMPAVWTVAAFGVIGVWFMPRPIKDRLVIAGLFMIGLTAASVGFLYRPHYFVFMLPAMALLFAVAIDFIMRWSRRLAVGNAIAVVCLVASLVQQRTFLFTADGASISRAIHGVNPFVASRAIARAIAENTNPQDHVAVLGSEPQIYFYAHRRAASPYIYTYPLMELHPHASAMQREMAEHIEMAQPSMMVFVEVHDSWLTRHESPRGIYNWFARYAGGYEVVALYNYDAAKRRYDIYHEEVETVARSDEWIEILRRK